MNLSDIDLRLLRIFRVIVEAEGVAPAEAKLDLSRSTISSHLNDLEVRLGMTLCTRGRSGFEMTDSGLAVYNQLTELLDHHDAFLTVIQNAGDVLKGNLTIAVLPGTTISGAPLQQAISGMKSKHPAVEFEILVGTPIENETNVLNSRAMFGFTVDRPIPDQLEFRPLYEEEYHLYCSTEHPLATATALQIEDSLADARIAGRKHSYVAFPLEGQRSADVSAVAHSAEALAHLILSGAYVGNLPFYVAHPLTEAGMLYRVPYDEMSVKSTVGLVQSVQTKTNPLAQEFLRELEIAEGS